MELLFAGQRCHGDGMAQGRESVFGVKVVLQRARDIFHEHAHNLALPFVGMFLKWRPLDSPSPPATVALKYKQVNRCSFFFYLLSHD